MEADSLGLGLGMAQGNPSQIIFAIVKNILAVEGIDEPEKAVFRQRFAAMLEGKDSLRSKRIRLTHLKEELLVAGLIVDFKFLQFIVFEWYAKNGQSIDNYIRL
jgi:hypothetical protein